MVTPLDVCAFVDPVSGTGISLGRPGPERPPDALGVAAIMTGDEW